MPHDTTLGRSVVVTMLDQFATIKKSSRRQPRICGGQLATHLSSG